MKRTALLIIALCSSHSAAALAAVDPQALLQEIDRRMTATIDFAAEGYLEQISPTWSQPVAYKFIIYRRDANASLVVLFTEPKANRGEGYLQINRNLWFYDPSVGKWARGTLRTHIAGSSANTLDFDRSTLAQDYTATVVGEQMLGKFKTHVLSLRVRPKALVAYPIVKLWVDQATGNIVKKQDFAASGKLMRTVAYPKWTMVHVLGANRWRWQLLYIVDELIKGQKTTIKGGAVDVRPMPANIFTKAWVESKSR